MLMLSVLILFLALTLLGTPLFFSFGLAATYACIAGDIPLRIIAQQMMIGMDSFTLLSIPGFILVGEIMCQGGIARRAVEFANSLMGHFKGGLSMVAVFTGMVMGGISGSAVADTAAVASVLVKSMEKENYPRDFSSAIVGTAGPLGNIIPPSIPMVVYSMVGGLSLLDLFLAGYIPGMMIGFSLMAFCHITSKKKGYGPKAAQTFSFRTVWMTFRRSVLAIFTAILIVGGIVSGMFTPTESAMIGAVYSLAVALVIYREMRLDQLPKVLCDSAKTTAKLVIIIASASVFSYISINEGIPELFRDFMMGISQNRIVLLLLLNVILMLAGCVIDILVATVIIVPVLIPLAQAVGIDQLQVAMIFVINMSIGLLTPPVGYCLFVSSAIAGIPMEKTAKSSIPIVILMIGILLLVTIFPQLTLLVPGLVH
jgi:tripartite ATP-independent transporter DctM subunit